ncbi:MAG TPA: isoaspartyl peptidase/L-asparaginase, partial [Flavisolibacter sp.]|nr:isoaspartyl peptidase/L-asparaginase [Flavisolibacter sp.]
IRNNIEGYKQGLEQAVNAGYAVLERGGPAAEAVEAAIRVLEDNPHFNAGRGAALNEYGEVEMCASMMNGADENAGAVAIVKGVKNPITLARAVMEKTKHTYIGSEGAIEFARQQGLRMEDESYFITEHARDEYRKAKEEQEHDTSATAKKHGTVGAVALDAEGNLAAGTSTGGLDLCKRGRIADSSMIGVGTYAHNETCAVSTTGEGEFHIRHVTAFHIAALIEYKGLSLEEACHFLIHEKCKHIKADMGLIGVDPSGELVAAYNTERMHRGFRSSTQPLKVAIYPGE